MPTVDSDIRASPDAKPYYIDASDPRGPWRVRADWASGDLYFNAATHFSVFLALFFGLAMLAVSFGFAYGLYDKLVSGSYRQGDYFALLPVVIAGTIGIAMTLVSTMTFVQGLKWRGSHFHLLNVPVPLGGALCGELRTSKPIAAGHKVLFKIECVSETEQVMRQSDGTTDIVTHYNTLWQDEESVVSKGGVIPVAFAIPADGRQTRLRSKSAKTDWSIQWQLTAEEADSGAEGYFGQFELPVFSIPITEEQKAEVESIRAARTRELEEYKPGPYLKVRITRTADGGVEFWFPPVRGAAKAFLQTLVFAGTLALLAMICLRGQPSIPLVAIWGLIDLGFFMWILRLWFAPERVVIAKGTLSYIYGILGRTRSMSTAEIVSIHAITGNYTTHHAIRIRGKGWRVLDVGDGISATRDAEWLARQMSSATGVKPADSIPHSSPQEQTELIGAFVEQFLGGGALGKVLGQKMPAMMEDEKAVMATELPRGMKDIKTATPATAYADSQDAVAQDVAGKTFGLAPRPVTDAQAASAVDFLQSATRFGTAKSTPRYDDNEDEQTAIAEDLARKAFGVGPSTRVQKGSPIRSALNFVPIILLAVVILVVCKEVVQVVAHTAKEVDATEAENGGTLNVPQGGFLRITLPISHDTGTWVITENDPAFIQKRGSFFGGASVNDRQTEVFLFSAMKTGRAYLTLNSYLPSDKSSPTGTFSVTLVID
jgi:hypothetical protein